MLNQWIPLDIEFKGDRTYLQSANVWDRVADFFLSVTEMDEHVDINNVVLDMIFRKRISKKVELYLTDGRPPKDERNVAQVVVDGLPTGRILGVLRETDVDETGRFEDIENSFREQVVLEENHSSYETDGSLPISFSQMCVAMNKFWHLEKVDGDCKWLVTRMQLPLSCLNAQPREIEISTETILQKGAGSISLVKRPDLSPASGRIYFFKSELEG